MKKGQVSILLCEDDITIAALLTEALRDCGYAVHHAINGKEGLHEVLNSTYDLCLLDIMMPEMTGLELLAQMRESGKQIPVIIVSQRSDREDIISGYKAGCDDYVTKPFSMDILLCKIEALLRRTAIAEESHQTYFRLGQSEFDSVRQTLNGEPLSGKENGLLLMLCRKSNQIVERSHILRTLWGEDNYFSSRSLSVYINHLRNRINSADARIMAIHGKGYKLVINE